MSAIPETTPLKIEAKQAIVLSKALLFMLKQCHYPIDKEKRPNLETFDDIPHEYRQVVFEFLSDVQHLYVA